MHYWYLLRAFRLFCYWANEKPSRLDKKGARIRYASLIFVFFILPMSMAVVCQINPLIWNPVIGIGDDDEPLRLLSYVLPAAYWGILWLANEAATKPECMPREVKQIFEAYSNAQEKLEWMTRPENPSQLRFSGLSTVQERFEKILFTRTAALVTAKKESSADQVVYRELSSIAADLGWHDLYKVTFDEFEKSSGKPGLVQSVC